MGQISPNGTQIQNSGICHRVLRGQRGQRSETLLTIDFFAWREKLFATEEHGKSTEKRPNHLFCDVIVFEFHFRVSSVSFCGHGLSNRDALMTCDLPRNNGSF